MRVFPYHPEKIAFGDFNKFAVADGENRCRAFVVEQKRHFSDKHVVRRHDGDELPPGINGIATRYDKKKIRRRLVLAADNLFVGVFDSSILLLISNTT